MHGEELQWARFYLPKTLETAASSGLLVDDWE